MKTLRNRQGQGLIETLAISAALTAVVCSLGGVLYFGMVHAGINYLLHEHLVCEQTQQEHNCEQTFKAKAKAWLFKARIYSFQSTKAHGNIRARIQIAMPLKRMLTLTKEMSVLR